MKEIWKEIKDFEDYDVSNLGAVKNTSTKMISKINIKNGYSYVNLVNNENKKTARVHRLVAKAFIVNDDIINKTHVNHKDGNKLNNKVDNLEWMTPSEDIQHAIDNGLLESQARPVLQYSKKGDLIKEYASIIEASKETSIDDGSICKVCKGNGVNKSAGGFIWKYKDDTILAKIEKPDDLTVIKNYPQYSISKTGKVYSHSRKRFLEEGEVDGYPRVYLTNNKKRKAFFVHRLVAETFIPNPENKSQVHYKNKNKNDTRVENLEWV